MTGQPRANATFLYGAGRMGREALVHCRAQGIEPRAFIDRAARPGMRVDGIRVIAPDVAASEVAGADVLVALHSPGVDIAAVVRSLRTQPFASISTLWAESERTGWLPRSPFWLAPRFDWSGEEDAIARARALLVDDTSRRVFDQQIALRRHGAYDVLGAPTPDDQYTPRDLAPWRAPMHLLDCGAYDGDTIRSLRAGPHAIERFVALEPDAANFGRLAASLGDDPTGLLVRAGAHSANGRLSFSAGEGGAAHLDPTGGSTIDVVRIDDLCVDFSPTLIKMDIEGAERDALEGATGTILRDRPDLAISVYHRVDDLWRIALQIDDLLPGYRFHLRSHAHNGFDTVLYAVASR